MGKFKHTPGPWHLIDGGGDTAIYDSQGEPVIGRGSFMSRRHPEAWANLRLSAAAPALLEALKRTRQILRGYMDAEYLAMNDDASVGLGQYLDNEIAKATGANP